LRIARNDGEWVAGEHGAGGSVCALILLYPDAANAWPAARRSYTPRYCKLRASALAAWVAVKLSTQASPGHRLENLCRIEISGEPAFAAAVMFDIAIAAALSDAGQAQVKLFDILVLPERLGVAV
jgi:hypothetical protein